MRGLEQKSQHGTEREEKRGPRGGDPLQRDVEQNDDRGELQSAQNPDREGVTPRKSHAPSKKVRRQ